MPGTQRGQAIQYMLSTVISQNTGSQRIKITKVTPCVYLMLRELTWEFQDTPETSPSPQNQRAPGAPWLSQWWRATPSTAQLSSREKCKKHTGGARPAECASRGYMSAVPRPMWCKALEKLVRKQASCQPHSEPQVDPLHLHAHTPGKLVPRKKGMGTTVGGGASLLQRVTAAEEPK